MAIQTPLIDEKLRKVREVKDNLYNVCVAVDDILSMLDDAVSSITLLEEELLLEKYGEEYVDPLDRSISLLRDMIDE